MITVESPLLVNGVVMFRDGADADLFWVLPAAPHLAGSPVGDSSFTLLEYRTADGTGGGFAELEIELSTPGAAALIAATGRSQARLAPVPFRSGDVSLLTAQGAGDTLVQAVLGSATSPLTPPFHTVFAMDVTEQGAALLAQSATLPTSPIGVVYQLRFLAQTPALHAHVTMAYDRIYDHFAASLGFTYYVSARLDLELSWLVEHGYVTIEITQFTDQADQQRQQQAVLDLVRARIEGDFFRTGLPQDPADTGMWGALGQLVGNQVGGKISSASALFVLQARLDMAKELKTFDIEYDGTTVEELTHVVAGFIGAMVPGAPSPPVIRRITAEDPFFATLDVKAIVAVDFADVPDLREAVVTLTYGARTQTYVATADTPGPFRFTCPLDAAVPDYRTHAEFHFDPESSAGAPTMTAADTTRRDRAYVVSSADAFTVLRVRLTAAGTATDLVPRLSVTLRAVPAAGGAAIAQDVFVLDQDHPQQDWYRRVPGAATDVRVLARTDWVDKNGNVHQGEETEVIGSDYRASGPIKETMSVLVQPSVDWRSVSQIFVEIRHQVIGTVQAQTLTFSAAAGTDPRSIELALDDPSQRSYQWRATVLNTDSTSAAGDWAVADSQVLTVGASTTSRPTVRVVWLGDVGSALAMQVDFWVTPKGGPEQQVASALLQPGQQDTSVSWAGDPGAPLAYRYEVHRLDATGDTLVKSGQDTSPLLVVRATG
jgi:hypothetical protein